MTTIPLKPGGTIIIREYGDTAIDGTGVNRWGVFDTSVGDGWIFEGRIFSADSPRECDVFLEGYIAALERCAKAAQDEAELNAEAGRRAEKSGRTNVASHRSSDARTARTIAAIIRQWIEKEKQG